MVALQYFTSARYVFGYLRESRYFSRENTKLTVCSSVLLFLYMAQVIPRYSLTGESHLDTTRWIIILTIC